MSFFKRQNTQDTSSTPVPRQNNFAELALSTIHDGVIITDRAGVIQYANPAAVIMLDCGSVDNAIGLDYSLLIKIETKEGRELSEAENPLIASMRSNQSLDNYACCLLSGAQAKRIPISISVLPVQGDKKIITFRNIAKELAEEGEQAEFISTASHEMRTPVATIDGYIALTLNPQTATIDDRARQYLEAAHAASQHLGHLFHDLLDVTKMDDGHIRPQFVPVEMIGEVKKIADDFIPRMKEAGLDFRFGSRDGELSEDPRRIDQVVYGFVDLGFLREIIDNLLDNAIKYTPNGGSVYVGVLGDGDRVLINVTDTGIGISSDDLQHIFQKFYRSDNSDTREVGGTGLGLYLVKQRVEAMGGKVWAESAFGDGSTFFVSLPRISGEEYEKRMIAVQNAGMVSQSTPQPQPAPQPVSQPLPQPTQPVSPTSPTPDAQPSPPAQPVATPQPIPPAPPAQINNQPNITTNNINGGIPQ